MKETGHRKISVLSELLGQYPLYLNSDQYTFFQGNEFMVRICISINGSELVVERMAEDLITMVPWEVEYSKAKEILMGFNNEILIRIARCSRDRTLASGFKAGFWCGKVDFSVGKITLTWKDINENRILLKEKLTHFDSILSI